VADLHAGRASAPHIGAPLLPMYSSSAQAQAQPHLPRAPHIGAQPHSVHTASQLSQPHAPVPVLQPIANLPVPPPVISPYRRRSGEID
jgi:hypothetical protein